MRPTVLLSQYRHKALVWMGLVFGIPVITLTFFGMLYLWQADVFLLVVISWLAITLLAYGLFVYWIEPIKNNLPINQNRSKHDATQIDLPSQLSTNPLWSDDERANWEACCTLIDTWLQEPITWESVPDHALILLSTVADHYHEQKPIALLGSGKTSELGFTLPQALLVTSMAASRYRELLISHVPYIDNIKLSTLVDIYNKQDSIKTGYTWLNRARRVIRLTNPVAALSSEVREHLSNQLLNRLTQNVQDDMQRLLLQEVAQVAIELYSGRLTYTLDEINQRPSSTFIQDTSNLPASAEPLRVVIVGQTSSGKSSLINKMTSLPNAEVDLLPTTNQLTTHVLSQPEQPTLHLVDTPGINSLKANSKLLIETATNSDLIIWVVKANQPARAPDYELIQGLKTYYDEHLEKKWPALVVVATHIDQLPPRNDWSPPYDLNGSDAKAVNIKKALNHVVGQIGLSNDTPCIPVSLTANTTPYNVNAVLATIEQLYDPALQTHWNRRRLEMQQQGNSYGERWRQMKSLGRVVGKAAFKPVVKGD